MISRGYFIGEIIDELTSIANQVETRCKLGLVDLNKYLEDFFKEYLNMTCKFNLENANENQTNTPGIDLVDNGKKIAFQITSQKDSDKINKTLEKCSTSLTLNNFKIYVLIIGKKQSSYTINKTLANSFSFDEKENIWDIDDLIKKSIYLNLESLQNLHRYIKQNVARISVDLEIPDENGIYKTTLYNYLESVPNTAIGNLNTLIGFIEEEGDLQDNDKKDLRKSVKKLSKSLAKLPRITREFYAIMLEISEYSNSFHKTSIFIPYEKLKRILTGYNIDEEINLLEHYKFIYVLVPESGDEDRLVKIIICDNFDYPDFLITANNFLKKNKCSHRNLFANMDFSIL